MPTQQPRVVLCHWAQQLAAGPSANKHPLCVKTASMELHRGVSTSPVFNAPIRVSDRTSGLLRCGDWDTRPATACSGLLGRASVEPDKPLSRRSGSTGQHVAGGESCTLMSRLVVSFPGCADRLDDVVLSQPRPVRRLKPATSTGPSIYVTTRWA